MDEKRAFATIYNQLWSKLYAVAYNYVRDKEIAQEIVQEVYVRLWVRRECLSEINDIHAFLMRMLQNYIYDYFDKLAVAGRYIQNNQWQDATPESEDALHQLEYTETFTLINKAVDTLPDTTKVVFQLSRFEHCSNEEIANRLNLSVKAVEYHITRSLKFLRVRLGNVLFLSIVLRVFW